MSYIRTIAGKYFVLLAVCILSVGFLAPQVSAATKTKVTFDLDKGKPIPKAIHGVNTNWYGFVPPITQSLTQDAIDRFGFSQVRFPGGTVGNYYDWKTFAPNWSLIYSLPDVPSFVKVQPKFEFHIESLSPLTFDPIIKGMGKEGTYVVNFSHNTNDEIITGMTKMKNNGITPKRLEFGNELYFRGTGMTPETYLRRSEIIAAKAKGFWPAVKVALVADRRLWRPKANNEPWDIPNRDWYDAVVIHAYSVAGGSVEEYVAWVTGDETDVGSRRYDFSKFIEIIKAKYPGKELWLTEWDLYQETDYQDTFAQTYYVYDFLLGMLKYPIVTTANHHALNDLRPQAEMNEKYLHPQNYKKIPDNTYTVDEFFVKQAAYWPLVWMGRALNRYDRFVANATPQNGVRAVYFYNSSHPKNGSIALVNTTGTAKTLTFIGIRVDTESFKLWTIAEPWTKKNKENDEITPQTVRSVGNNMTLPPYAIAYAANVIETVPTTPPGRKAADINGDGRVDSEDWSIMRKEFGKRSQGQSSFAADIVKNGVIDLFDYNIIVEQYEE